MNELVNHPDHYRVAGWEAIDVIEDLTKTLDGFEAFCLGNVIKYLVRYPRKNGLEDLKKARWYLDRMIKESEEDGTEERRN